MKHTPWTYSEDQIEKEWVIDDAKGEIIAVTDCEARARFIVAACNCHEELVRALEKLYAVWRDQVDTSGELASINIPIEEILAKARGEQR